jgi:hypothetical protein
MGCFKILIDLPEESRDQFDPETKLFADYEKYLSKNTVQIGYSKQFSEMRSKTGMLKLMNQNYEKFKNVHLRGYELTKSENGKYEITSTPLLDLIQWFPYVAERLMYREISVKTTLQNYTTGEKKDELQNYDELTQRHFNKVKSLKFNFTLFESAKYTVEQEIHELFGETYAGKLSCTSHCTKNERIPLPEVRSMLKFKDIDLTNINMQKLNPLYIIVNSKAENLYNNIFVEEYRQGLKQKYIDHLKLTEVVQMFNAPTISD